MFVYRQIFFAYFFSALGCVHQPFLCLLLNRHAPALIYGLDPFAKSMGLIWKLTCLKIWRIKNLQVLALMILKPNWNSLNRSTMYLIKVKYV